MAETTGKRTAGLFDLRYILAILFGIYGIVLTIMGAIGNTPAEDVKTGGININLWTGIAMLIATVLFVLWARLRPVVIEATVTPDEMNPDVPTT